MIISTKPNDSTQYDNNVEYFSKQADQSKLYEDLMIDEKDINSFYSSNNNTGNHKRSKKKSSYSFYIEKQPVYSTLFRSTEQYPLYGSSSSSRQNVMRPAQRIPNYHQHPYMDPSKFTLSTSQSSLQSPIYKGKKNTTHPHVQ